MHNYTETLRIFMTCASIVPLILQKFPLASFVINGAQNLDLESNKIENLFITGELLDLDAETGGYNLQIAFSTGYLAGLSLN